MLRTALIALVLLAAGCGGGAADPGPEPGPSEAPAPAAEPGGWKQAALITSFHKTYPELGRLGFVGRASDQAVETSSEELPAGFTLHRLEVKRPETTFEEERFVVSPWRVEVQFTNAGESDARLWALYYDAEGEELGRSEFTATASPTLTLGEELSGPEGDQAVTRIVVSGAAPTPPAEGIPVAFDERELGVRLISAEVSKTEGGHRLSCTLENAGAERDVLLVIRWLTASGGAASMTERAIARFPAGEQRPLTLTQEQRAKFPVQRVHVLVKAARPPEAPAGQ